MKCMVAVLALILCGCNKPGKPKKEKEAPPVEEKKEAPPPKPQGPERVTVQIITILYKTNATEGQGITRSREEAKSAADEVVDKAKKGEEFESLVAQYSDGRDFPGRYYFCNFDVKPIGDEKPRADAINQRNPVFDLAFSLKVNEVRMLEPLPRYPGFIVMKRLP